ncbi:MAG: superoxide dismutase family protein [Betaproteobacteria bacterium]
MRMLNVVAAVAALLAGGCASMGGQEETRATATLESTKGNDTAGSVTFVQRGNQVFVSADIRGLKPNQEHGFHVHEKGDCSSGDGMSAGGHFNPDGVPHGHAQPTDTGHAGDMPNLKADTAGNAKVSFAASRMTVAAGQFSIVGKGLIVHRDPDDYKTQPTGNAGPRLACAVIKAA